MAGERLPALFLVEAGCFADEHQLCVGITRPEDDLGPRLCEGAPSAAGGFGRVGGESRGTREGVP